MLLRIKRRIFRLLNRFLNKFGVLLSVPDCIHGSPAFSGATLYSRRLIRMKHFFSLISKVEGDIVESGVHWGYGILMEFTLLNEYRKIYGFDSFKGHSKPAKEDFSGGGYQPLDSSFKITQEDVWKTLTMGTEKNVSYLKKKN